MPNNSNILVGSPNQTAVTGAIKRAALGTTGPTDASTALNTWTAGGYVDEDGVSLSPELSTSDIRDWSKALQRKLVDSFDGTITFTYLEFGDIESLKQQFGDKYVEVGENNKIKISIGGHLGEIQSWVIDIKDGDVAVRIYVPKGQVTEMGELSFVAGEAIKSQTTLSCYDDGTGNSVYIFIDGLTVALPSEDQQ